MWVGGVVEYMSDSWCLWCFHISSPCRLLVLKYMSVVAVVWSCQTFAAVAFVALKLIHLQK